MKSKKLLKKLSELGFPLFEREEKLDADSVLAQVAKIRNDIHETMGARAACGIIHNK